MATPIKRHHICPPSNAKHPADRWETAFVYAFITKFTSLKQTIEGFEGAMDLELAVLRDGPDPLLVKILAAFVLNLRPNSRNIGPDSIANTVGNLLLDFLRTPERSVFWDEQLNQNVDPLSGIEGGFWVAPWDIKLRILRQLVEYQLTHCLHIRAMIDGAWGVKAAKHKKKTADSGPPPPEDPASIQNLRLLPIGQDIKRLRYWVIDDSPRVYRSSNPWKVSAKFESVATSRDDYIALVKQLKTELSPENEGTKRSRIENGHLDLVKALEARIEAIDSDINRIEKLRKKIAQRDAMIALAASIPETRARRQTRRPDYVYDDGGSGMDDDEDPYQDEEYDDDDLDIRSGTGSISGPRRSARTGNAKRSDFDPNEWRGERRSSRLGALPPDTDFAPPLKRARTVSSPPPDRLPPIKKESGPLLKPNEIVAETVAGRKKSKFWFYALEPVPGTSPPGIKEESKDEFGPSDGTGEEKSTEPSIDESIYGFGRKGSRGGGRSGSVTSLSDEEMADK